MTLNEIWAKSYNEYVQFLITKYGSAEYDYYRTPECKTKSDIVRTKEGLECHHIDEDKYPDLSDRSIALQHPFSLQKAERLVYADMIEHLILHIKIDEMELCNKNSSGVYMLVGSINSIFEEVPTTGWRLNMYNKIKENFDLYIEVLHRLAKESYGYNSSEVYGQYRKLFLKENTSVISDYELLNTQVDIELLHDLAHEMVEKYPRLWECPKEDKAKRHWFFLTSTLFCKGPNRKQQFFPYKVAKAFAIHESKSDYMFVESSDNQMTIDDLLK